MVADKPVILDQPVILYECKPVVDMQHNYVCEYRRPHGSFTSRVNVLLPLSAQSSSCHTVLNRLIDGWHYFRLESYVPGGRTAHVQYSWYNDYRGMEVKSHVCFLQGVVPCLLQRSGMVVLKYYIYATYSAGSIDQ